MFNLFYYKPKNRDFLKNLEETVTNSQNYVPIYQTFFDLNESNYNSISFNHRNHVVDLDKIYDCSADKTITQHVFIKYSPVLDPIHYMMGKYDIRDPRIQNLPQLNSTEETCFPKLLDTNNSSYVDGFFTFLSSVLLQYHGFFHGVDYYGSFMGIQREFKINVVEDLEHLDGSEFFHKHLNKLFSLDYPLETSFFCDNSRNCKNRLLISDENVELEFDDIAPAPASENIDLSFSPRIEDPPVENANVDVADKELKIEYENQKQCPDESVYDNDDSSSLNYTSDGDDMAIDDLDEDSALDEDSNSNSDSDSNFSTIDDDETSNNSDVFASIYNFPVNMICMEKCSGTLDSIMNSLAEHEWRSALFQVIMILLVYQKAFYLTHNDLHTNNIMYVETTHKHIYYKFNGECYKVPTYGRIYKIIDYGRAIYTFRGRLFCSDSFAFHGDAATQYNFPPYYNDKKPRIDPNYSFDLCRLGCSIYDFVFEDENTPPRTEFERIILEWCTDDNGKNVMYKKSGEERYMDFKLYKMIARTVHNHTPDAQLKHAFFQPYHVLGVIDSAATAKGLYLNIDGISCYVDE